MSKKYIMCNCCGISLSFLLSQDGKLTGCWRKAPLRAGVSRATLEVTNESGLHRHSGKFWSVDEGLECERQEEQQELQMGLRGPEILWNPLSAERETGKLLLNKDNLWFTYYNKSVLHRVWDSKDHHVQILGQENVNLVRQKMEWDQLLLRRQLFMWNIGQAATLPMNNILLIFPALLLILHLVIGLCTRQ